MHPAVTAAIIVAVIGPLAWHILSMPDPVWVASNNPDNICLRKLDFNDNVSNFVFTFNNLGQDKGIFDATISSDEVLIKYKDSNQEFAFKNSKGWTVSVNEPVSFQFVLKLSENIEEPETINIEINLSCSRYVFGILPIPCMGESHTCNYQNQHVEHLGPDYELIN